MVRLKGLISDETGLLCRWEVKHENMVLSNEFQALSFFTLTISPPLAQLLEHRAATREAVSSTPPGPTRRVFKEGGLLLLLRIRSAHLEMLRFPVGGAYKNRDILVRFKTMRRKKNLASALGIQKRKLGITMHFSEIIKLHFCKKNVIHCFVV